MPVKEKETYTIRLLEDKDYLEMDKRFSNIEKKDLEKSLGFADKETGEAYIRKTSIKDVDMEVVQHEIQELMSETSDHEKNGIRFGWFHKMFGFSSQPAVRALAPLAAAAIPGIGPVLSGLLAAATSGVAQKTTTGKISPAQVALSGLGGGLLKGAMAPGIAAAKGAGKGILGQVGTGLKGAIMGAPKAAAATTSGALQGPVTAAQSAMGYSNLSQVPSNILGSQAATAALGKGLGPLQGPVTAGQAAQGYTNLSQVPQTLGATGAAQAPTTVGAPTPGATPPPTLGSGQVQPAGVTAPVPAAPTFTGQLGDVAKKLMEPKNLLGLGALGAGAAPTAPEFQMPESVSRLEEAFMNQGVSEVGIAARGELLKTLRATPAELYPVAGDEFIEASLRGSRESYERAMEQLDASYNQAGVYGSGEHLAAQDNLREELAQLESDFIALENNRRFELGRVEKQNAVVSALQDAGLTEANIMEIASLDVWAASQKFGAEVSDMQTIKEALSGIGSEILTGAFKKPEEAVIGQ